MNHTEQHILPLDRNHRAGVIDEYSIGLGLVPGMRFFTLFGTNHDVDAAEDIWNGGGVYSGFPDAAAENLVVQSTSAADTLAGTGAQKIRVYYYDADFNMFDGDDEQLFVDIDMNGVTAVDTGIPVARVHRAAVILSGSGQGNAGVITGNWITTTTAIFFQMDIGTGVSESPVFTIPLGYRAYIKNFNFGMDDNTAKTSEVLFKVKAFGGNTFLEAGHGRVTTDKDYTLNLLGSFELPEKMDIKTTVATVSSANSIVHVIWEILIVKNVM